MKNINSVDMGHLSLENLQFQFCSDWLKCEIAMLLNRLKKTEKIIQTIGDCNWHQFPDIVEQSLREYMEYIKD